MEDENLDNMDFPLETGIVNSEEDLYTVDTTEYQEEIDTKEVDLKEIDPDETEELYFGDQ